MRKHDYLICYDIAEEKRLAKIARFLEKEAFRLQYSIFLLNNVSKEHVYKIAHHITELIDPNEDDVRIYTIVDKGEKLGVAYDLDEIFIIR